MRISIKKKKRKLEKISEGDILVFSDREEIVEGVNVQTSSLYTSRTTQNRDRNSSLSPKDFPIKVEKVAYREIEEIAPFSKGRVYDWEKRRKTT